MKYSRGGKQKRYSLLDITLHTQTAIINLFSFDWKINPCSHKYVWAAINIWTELFSVTLISVRFVEFAFFLYVKFSSNLIFIIRQATTPKDYFWSNIKWLFIWKLAILWVFVLLIVFVTWYQDNAMLNSDLIAFGITTVFILEHITAKCEKGDKPLRTCLICKMNEVMNVN